MDAARVSGSYTTDYIEALPEGERAELINGQLYMMATPETIHQEISMFLSNIIYNYIKAKKGNCKVYPAPFAVYLNKDNKNYVEPDISIICDTGKIDKKGCHGAPDWVIEIVSPSSQTMDYLIKQSKYGSAGVRDYWIVNPHNKTIEVFSFEKQEVQLYSFTDKVKANIYDDLEIDFSELEL